MEKRNEIKLHENMQYLLEKVAQQDKEMQAMKEKHGIFPQT